MNEKNNRIFYIFSYLIIVIIVSYIFYKLNIIEISGSSMFGSNLGDKNAKLYVTVLTIIDMIYAFIIAKKTKLNPFLIYFIIIYFLLLSPFVSAFLGYIIKSEYPFFEALIWLPLYPAIFKNKFIVILTLFRVPALIGAIIGEVTNENKQIENRNDNDNKNVINN